MIWNVVCTRGKSALSSYSRIVLLQYLIFVIRYHLRATSSRNPSPNLIRKSPNPSCCLCLRESPAEDFISLPSNPASGGSQALQVCKSCYVRYTQGLPILNSPYEHVRHGVKEVNVNWDHPREKWDPKSRPKDFANPHEPKVTITEDEIVQRCEDCGVKFELPEELETHRTQEHKSRDGSQPKTYTCIQCQVSPSSSQENSCRLISLYWYLSYQIPSQMSFASESEIQKHVRKEHLESPGKSCESLRCHLCLTEASSPLQLQAHLIEHTFAGCSALSCYICQALFTAPAGLQVTSHFFLLSCVCVFVIIN